jgi:hypothetical protein
VECIFNQINDESFEDEEIAMLKKHLMTERSLWDWVYQKEGDGNLYVITKPKKLCDYDSEALIENSKTIEEILDYQ